MKIRNGFVSNSSSSSFIIMSDKPLDKNHILKKLKDANVDTTTASYYDKGGLPDDKLLKNFNDQLIAGLDTETIKKIKILYNQDNYYELEVPAEAIAEWIEKNIANDSYIKHVVDDIVHYGYEIISSVSGENSLFAAKHILKTIPEQFKESVKFYIYYLIIEDILYKAQRGLYYLEDMLQDHSKTRDDVIEKIKEYSHYADITLSYIDKFLNSNIKTGKLYFEELRKYVEEIKQTLSDIMAADNFDRIFIDNKIFMCNEIYKRGFDFNLINTWDDDTQKTLKLAKKYHVPLYQDLIHDILIEMHKRKHYYVKLIKFKIIPKVSKYGIEDFVNLFDSIIEYLVKNEKYSYVYALSVGDESSDSISGALYSDTDIIYSLCQDNEIEIVQEY